MIIIWKTMIDKRKQKFVKYISYLRDQMRLKDWNFKVSNDNPSGSNILASVYTAYGSKMFTIYLSDDFLNQSKEKQRHTLVHELVHVHLAPAYDLAIAELEPKLRNVFERMSEYDVDGMADVMVPFFKLP